MLLPTHPNLDSLSAGDRFFPDQASPDPILAEVSGEILSLCGGAADAMIECAYRNGTDRMVILRCLGPSAFFLERVLFPFELLTFACPPECEVEIQSNGLGGPELLESMPALLLRLGTPVSAVQSDEPTPWLQAG